MESDTPRQMENYLFVAIRFCSHVFSGRYICFNNRQHGGYLHN